jgi:lipid-binding SYLF domain-containing protein
MIRTLTAICLLAFAAVPVAHADSKEELDAKVREARTKLAEHTSAGAELAAKAKGVLVFPSVIKAGFGIGGEFGEGALQIGGATVDYYNIASASIGLQLGAQARTQIVLFMTDDALKTFRDSKGWKAGVDGSVALATLGAGGTIDTKTAQQPIIGFIFSNKGLMYNLTFEGSKITKIEK